MSMHAVTEELAAASASPEEAPVFLMDGTRTSGAGLRILPHDFQNPTTISESDLSIFEALYVNYVQDLAGRLSSSLRMDCALKITKVAGAPFSEFRDVIPNPSCISLFRAAEMRGVGVLNLSLPLALAVADRLLGGKGKPPAAERELTEIETALLDDTLLVILSGWAGVWSEGEAPSQLEIIAHERNALCLPMTSTKELFVVLEMEMNIGENACRVHLGVPFSMLETRVRKIQESQKRITEAASPRQIQWRNQYAEIAVPVFAEWKVRKMPLAEALRIRTGDIIELPASLINQARIQLSHGTAFTGTVGIQNGNIAVQITGPSSKEN